MSLSTSSTVDDSHRIHLQYLISALIPIGIAILAIFGTWLYCDIRENQRIDAEAVAFLPELRANFGAAVRVSDFLAHLNGELVDNPLINTEVFGQQLVTFDYVNIKHRRRSASFLLQIVDQTSPRIIGSSSYTVPLGYTGDLIDLMLSGDDCDDSPTRTIIGEYNLNRAGTYALEYSITDASGNQTTHPFSLHVVKPSSSASTNITSASTPLAISDVIRQHKTAQTKIGIDVSQWQGQIDWSAVRSAGVEFAFIRVGYQVGYGGEYVLDPYFVRNITAANRLGLPVGVYFYSYADSFAQAQSQAAWITDQLSGHTVDLGVAFDWENWSSFNSAGLSFFTLNKIADTFLTAFSDAGYQGILYSSKYYLDQIWLPTHHQTWLAQYYDHVTYTGDYHFWQMSDSGRVPGIDGNVDLDIMYLQD